MFLEIKWQAKHSWGEEEWTDQGNEGETFWSHGQNWQSTERNRSPIGGINPSELVGYTISCVSIMLIIG